MIKIKVFVFFFFLRAQLDFAYSKTLQKLSTKLHKISQNAQGLIFLEFYFKNYSNKKSRNRKKITKN